MQPRTALEWTRRLERARRLRDDRSAAGQLLGFYEEVLQVQMAIAEELAVEESHYRPGIPFLEQLDLRVPLRHLTELLDVAMRRGTDVLAEAAKEFTDPEIAKSRILSLLGQRAPTWQGTPEHFFVLALAQPAAEHLASAAEPSPATTSRCPVCDSLPLLAALRPEGDGGKRFLQCSLCLTEWAYRRVLCPRCGETDKDKLPRYTADECNYVRVEACDTCKHYLKSVDQTVNGNAVPMVDEIALAALDVWAAGQGFKKIAPNVLAV